MKKMKTKTTMRYHFIHIRMATVKKQTKQNKTKTENKTFWQECGENGTPVHCKIVQPL